MVYGKSTQGEPIQSTKKRTFEGCKKNLLEFKEVGVAQIAISNYKKQVEKKRGTKKNSDIQEFLRSSDSL